MQFTADLHIHSCLSPCGSLYNSPTKIVETAVEKGLDCIALTDHNSSRNCPAFAEVCKKAGINAIFGMEATSSEEAHCLCLFEDLDTAMEFDAFIEKHMIKQPFIAGRMGDQVIVNAEEEVIGDVDYLLISAGTLSVADLNREVHRRGGLFIPAHVDRSAFSLMSQLGFIPDGDYDALEWYNINHRHRPLSGYPHCTNSDAHYPEDIAARTTSFQAEQPDFAGLRAWFASQRRGS